MGSCCPQPLTGFNQGGVKHSAAVCPAPESPPAAFISVRTGVLPAVAPASPRAGAVLSPMPQHDEAPLLPGQCKLCSKVHPDWLQAVAEIPGDTSSGEAGSECLQDELSPITSPWLPSKCWVSGGQEGFFLIIIIYLMSNSKKCLESQL